MSQPFASPDPEKNITAPRLSAHLATGSAYAMQISQCSHLKPASPTPTPPLVAGIKSPTWVSPNILGLWVRMGDGVVVTQMACGSQCKARRGRRGPLCLKEAGDIQGLAPPPPHPLTGMRTPGFQLRALLSLAPIAPVLEAGLSQVGGCGRCWPSLF